MMNILNIKPLPCPQVDPIEVIGLTVLVPLYQFSPDIPQSFRIKHTLKWMADYCETLCPLEPHDEGNRELQLNHAWIL